MLYTDMGTKEEVNLFIVVDNSYNIVLQASCRPVFLLNEKDRPTNKVYTWSSNHKKYTLFLLFLIMRHKVFNREKNFFSNFQICV